MLHPGTAQMRIERRGDIAGRERIDVDVMAAELDGQRLGEVDHTALRGAVGRTIRPRAGPEDRRDVDDLAVSLAAELGKHAAHQEERTFEVEVELFVPNFLRRLFHRHGAEHTGIVHHDVHRPVGLDHASDQTLDLLDLGTIGLERLCLAAAGPDVGDDLVGLVLALGIVHRDLGAFPGVALGDRLADALRGTGHDRHLVLESHRSPHEFRPPPRYSSSILEGAMSALGSFTSLWLLRSTVRMSASHPKTTKSLRSSEMTRCARKRHKHRSRQHHYSITSSALASSVGGTLRPSIRAVSALMTRSNLLDCTTGRSAGLAPVRMRPA